MIWPSMRVLLAAAAGILLIAGIAVGGWFWYSAQQQRALAAHAEVMTRVAAAQGAQAPAEARAAAMRDLERLIEEYPSAPTVAQAAFELGNLRSAAREYPAARSAYEIALARGTAGTIRTMATAAIAHTHEAEREWGKAIESYQALARDLDPKHFLYEEALLGLARAQEQAGRKAEAVETYQRILKDVPASRRAEDIRMRLASLGSPAPQ